MTTRFDTKDPGETVTLEFDYTKLGGTPTDPDITAETLVGEDASPSAVLQGLPAVVGDKVYQKATAGLNGVDYAVKCYADTPNGDRLLIDGILPVRTRPTARS